MTKMSRILIAMVLVAVLGGGLYLATWDFPAPTARVEKVVSDARFKQ